MRSVDEQVKAFYAGQAMPEERAREILRRAGERRRIRRRRFIAALAAIIAVALGSAWISAQLSTRNLVDRAAAEVAMNHRKDLAVEVTAASYAELGQALDKLPFTLGEPADPRLHGYRLEGGRYCSIQAQLAAQLKVHHPTSGRRATLYITELTDDLVSLAGAHRAVGDVSIDLWQDRGLLYALAEDAPPAGGAELE